MRMDSVVDSFMKRAKVSNRADLLCMRCNKVGEADKGHIYNTHYTFVEQLPTRVQIQSALNRDFGENVVMDPTSVMGGKHSVTAKVFAMHRLEEFDRPKVHVSNLTTAINEKPNACYVEVGDIVRFFDASVTEGQVVGFDQDKFSIRVADKILPIGADAIIDVKASPKFRPVADSAYDYFIKLFPPAFTKLLVNKNPASVENKEVDSKELDKPKKG